MSFRDLYQRRQGTSAVWDTESAAGLEGAAGGHGLQRRDRAFDGFEGVGAIGFQVGHGVQETASVGVCRGAKNFVASSTFDYAAGIHHDHAGGDLRDHGEIVGDEEHGQAELGAQLSQQVEDLGLDGDVERGGGLVGDEQLRAVDDGHGDHDALAHAAGKLVRIIAGAAFGFGDGDVGHGLNGESRGLALGAGSMSEHGLGDLIADAHDGIESGHRFLEDHGDARATQLTHGVWGKRGEVAGGAVLGEEDIAGNAGLGRKQAHDGKGCDRFAGTRFANQAKNFARGNGEAEVADGGER